MLDRMERTVRKAVIPAAGLGTRFLPVTKAIPKEMLPVVDKPAIQYVVEEARSAGIEDVLLVSSPYKKAVEDHFDRSFELERRLQDKGKTADVEALVALSELARVHIVRQGEPMGLGHAVGMARHHVGREPFAVLLPDDLMVDGGELLRGMIATLADTGRSDRVLQLRHDYQLIMRDDLIRIVERQLQRKVIAFMSQNHIDPDLAVEVFVLEPIEAV